MSTPWNAAITTFQIFSAFASVSAQSSLFNPRTYEGCFTSLTEMQGLGPYVYQAPRYCQKQCVNLNNPLMGTSQGSHCWYGDLLPAPSSRVAHADDRSSCTGYEPDSCRSMQDLGVVCSADIIGGCGPNALSVNLTEFDGNVGSNIWSLDTNRTLAATAVSGIVSKDSSIASTTSKNTTTIHCNIFIENTLVIYRSTIRNDYGHHCCCSTSCRGMCVLVACCSISEVSKKALVELPADERMLGKRALRSAEHSK